MTINASTTPLGILQSINPLSLALIAGGVVLLIAGKNSTLPAVALVGAGVASIGLGATG